MEPAPWSPEPRDVEPVDVLPLEAVTADPVHGVPAEQLSFPPRAHGRRRSRDEGGGTRALYHLTPLGLIALVMLVVVGHDLLVSPGGKPEEVLDLQAAEEAATPVGAITSPVLASGSAS